MLINESIAVMPKHTISDEAHSATSCFWEKQVYRAVLADDLPAKSYQRNIHYHHGDVLCAAGEAGSLSRTQICSDSAVSSQHGGRGLERTKQLARKWTASAYNTHVMRICTAALSKQSLSY